MPLLVVSVAAALSIIPHIKGGGADILISEIVQFIRTRKLPVPPQQEQPRTFTSTALVDKLEGFVPMMRCASGVRSFLTSARCVCMGGRHKIYEL